MLHVYARTHSQTISLSVKNAKLDFVFKEIQKQTGYAFVYSNDDLQPASKITIQIKEASLERALDICLKEQPLTYNITNKIVVIKKKPAMQPNESSPLAIDVKGRVTNEKGEPVAGATITVKGTNKAVTTNENGEFVFTGIDENATLVVSSVSFESREIKIAGQSSLTVQLKVKPESLDSVVVSTIQAMNIFRKKELLVHLCM